jgi:hypothetical protein
MKKVIDLLYHAFMEKQLDYVLVSSVDEGGYNHLSISDNEAEQIVKDHGFHLEILERDNEIFEHGHYSKYKFTRVII